MKKAPITLGTVNLVEGVVPVTQASASLATLLKRARVNREHIVLTQNGRSAGVLIDIEQYTIMRRLAEIWLEHAAEIETQEDERPEPDSEPLEEQANA